MEESCFERLINGLKEYFKFRFFFQVDQRKSERIIANKSNRNFTGNYAKVDKWSLLRVT